VAGQLELDRNETEMLEHIILQMETERGLDRSAAMAEMRFDYIQKVSEACVVKPEVSREHLRSRRMDRILTGKYTAIPVFIGLMALVFYLTFFLVGPFFQDLLASGIDALKGAVETGMVMAGVNAALQSLIHRYRWKSLILAHIDLVRIATYQNIGIALFLIGLHLGNETVGKGLYLGF
jgi:ferrous iron transport protein B